MKRTANPNLSRSAKPNSHCDNARGQTPSPQKSLSTIDADSRPAMSTHGGALRQLISDDASLSVRHMSTHGTGRKARGACLRFLALHPNRVSRGVVLCGVACGLFGMAGTRVAHAQVNRNRVDPLSDTPAIVPVMPKATARGGATQKTTPGAKTTSPTTPGGAAVGVDDALERGRALLAANDARAIPLLRTVALRALDELRALAPNAVAARDGIVDYATTTTLPDYQGPALRGRERAARAHLWWGTAESRLGDRDRAITALARAVILSSSAPVDEDAPPEGVTPLADGAPGGETSSADFVLDSTTLRETRRNAAQNLNGLLRQGLPVVAPDDVLSVVASRMHGGLWRPRRFRFELPTLAFSPPSDGAARGTASLASASREFLITSGKLFPSETRAPNSDSPRLWRVPPLYSGVAADALPPSLKMDRTVVGYERVTSGPNTGLWHQKVRVFYASTYVTRDNRDDGPRAQSLCAQFLKVSALMREGAGLGNRYAPDGVSTLWLCEVSALWPADDASDETPARPLRAPLVPAATATGSRATQGIVATPLSRPWRAGAWLDSAPGDILLFRLTQPRDEAEWLRELVHEYSHIAVPPFSGFAPPLEPFGNGALGETLGMLWAASETRAPANRLVSHASADIALRPLFANPTSLAAFPSANPRSNVAAKVAELNSATTFAPIEAWEDADDAFVTPTSRTSAPRITASARITASGWSRAMETHVGLNALPALRIFNARGPLPSMMPNGAPSSSGARDDLRYLQGVAVYLERVYGARVLGAALVPLASNVVPDSNAAIRSAMNGAARRPGMPPLLNANTLLNSAQFALREPFERGQARLPIWLPGAMSPLPSLGAAALSSRAPLQLRAGQSAGAWIFVPAQASTLRVQWRDAAPSAALQLVANRLSASVSKSASSGTLSIATSGRAGWHRLIFRATGTLTLSGAWFERAAV